MSKENNNVGWTTVSIRKELAEEIDRFIEEQGRKRGYTNRPDVINDSIRKFLDEIKIKEE